MTTLPHDRPQPEYEPTRLRAEEAFGQAAHGLFDGLADELGKRLARLLLDWLLSRQQHESAPQSALVDSSTLRQWAAAMLRAHRAEVLAMIHSQVDSLYDAAVDALDAA